MKESAGEANMTVITIVLIAIVLGVGAILVPRLLHGTEKSSCCQQNGGVWHNNICYSSCTVDDAGEYTCSSTTISSDCN